MHRSLVIYTFNLYKLRYIHNRYFVMYGNENTIPYCSSKAALNDKRCKDRRKYDYCWQLPSGPHDRG
jgi:hypothetical protein